MQSNQRVTPLRKVLILATLALSVACFAYIMNLYLSSSKASASTLSFTFVPGSTKVNIGETFHTLLTITLPASSKTNKISGMKLKLQISPYLQYVGYRQVTVQSGAGYFTVVPHGGFVYIQSDASVQETFLAPKPDTQLSNAVVIDLILKGKQAGAGIISVVPAETQIVGQTGTSTMDFVLPSGGGLNSPSITVGSFSSSSSSSSVSSQSSSSSRSSSSSSRSSSSSSSSSSSTNQLCNIGTSMCENGWSFFCESDVTKNDQPFWSRRGPCTYATCAPNGKSCGDHFSGKYERCSFDSRDERTYWFGYPNSSCEVVSSCVPPAWSQGYAVECMQIGSVYWRVSNGTSTQSNCSHYRFKCDSEITYQCLKDLSGSTWWVNQGSICSAIGFPGGSSSSSSSSSSGGGARSQVGLLFKAKFPDIAPSVNLIPGVQVEWYDGDQLSCADCSTFVSLVRDGAYFKTNQPVSFSVNTGRQHTVKIKAGNTIRRSFSGIQFTANQTLDCTGGTMPSACGELKTKIETKPLWSGDTDRFNNYSDSYSKIDSVDLQMLSMKYGTTSSEADFNSDGQVDIIDLDILGRNYGLQGD